MENGAAVQVAGGGAAMIRDLASCNKSTRDRALKLVLKTWLPSQQPGQVSDDDMKKLWKGLFYCVWHADKSPVQLELINRLSSLLLTLELPLSLHYLSVFFLTMRREWTGIDALRLDKFYLLIRRFLSSSFLMLKKNCSWDFEVSRRFMAILEERTFFADDKFLGNGVNYHIASVFLEELKPFLPVGSQVLDVIFKPFLRVMQSSQDKVLLGKVKSNVFDLLLRTGRSLLELKKLGDEHASAIDSGNNDVVVLGTIALTMGFSAKFYDLGTSPDCFQGNRKILFSLHEDFMRLEKDLGTAGIEISISDVIVDEEVPQLVLITTETESGVSASDVDMHPMEVDFEGAILSSSKLSKRKKKAKKASVGSENDKELDKANKKASKKKKKEKKKERIPEQSSTVKENGNPVIANGDSCTNGTIDDANKLIFNKSVISNLQMQFEKVAEEVALDKDGSSSHGSSGITVSTTVAKKRKRVKRMEGQQPDNVHLNGEDDSGVDAASSAAKSAKKVRFSMKNNLVWKPHSPLPPQNLRLPPSVAPRGSALKKGIPPGPIREMPPATKRVKKKKKGRKGIRVVSTAVKRLRKLQTLGI
ncbi:hypothetical protein NMG60_11021714 [Bertholletia excelsa]